MKRFISLLLLSITLTPYAIFAFDENRKPELPTKTLNKLDNVLQDAKQYDAIKKHHIDSLQKQLHKTKPDNSLRRWNLNMEIGNQFRVFSADSSLAYFQSALLLAEQCANDSLLLYSRIARLNALSSAGIFTEAEDELLRLETIEPQLSDNMKIELWKAGRQMYSYMVAYIDEHQEFSKSYTNKFIEYDDKLLESLPVKSDYYRFLSAERMIYEGKYKQAKKELESLLQKLPDNSNLYGMAAYQMAEVYRNQGDESEYARYLALSAISDIKGSVKETLSLPTLAKWLYEQGEVDRAFQYINASLEDAMIGNARMRTVSIARFVPLIDDAYRKKINSSHDKLMVYFLLVTILFVIIAVLLFFVVRQMKRVHDAKKKLSATNKIQESYIGNFVELCSSYADKLESTTKLVSRKLAAGQSDELIKMIKSGKFVEQQNEDFYKVFDSAFLDIYPDFIDEINKLLRDDEQIIVKKGQGLPTELRIYAFVRLGVEESTRISQILHYSVSTIYTYRNKMRNKAIDRENFEANVMKIDLDID